MPRIELKGKFLAVEPVQAVGEKGKLKQVIIFETLAYRDEYGDVKGENEQWELAVMGDSIAKLGISGNAVGRNAKITVYVNSRRFEKEDPATKKIKIFYPVNLILNKVEFAPEKATA